VKRPAATTKAAEAFGKIIELPVEKPAVFFSAFTIQQVSGFSSTLLRIPLAYKGICYE